MPLHSAVVSSSTLVLYRWSFARVDVAWDYPGVQVQPYLCILYLKEVEDQQLKGPYTVSQQHRK